jgi:branched-chain amino acid transport system permease protein
VIQALRSNRYVGKVAGGLLALLLAVYTFGPQSSSFGAGLSLGQFAVEMLPAVYLGIQALCLVLIYRTVRIVNFAQVAFGVIAQQLFYEFYTRELLAYPFAWPIAIIGGTLITLIVGIILSTLFYRHPRLTLTVVTVFMTSIIAFASGEITAAFTPPGETVEIRPIPLDGTFEHDSLGTLGVVPFRVAHLVGLIMVALTLAGLVLFFRRSRAGVAIRASAENSDRASLLGINVKLINIMVWGIVGFVTSVAAVAKMPVAIFVPGGTNEAFSALLPALCAAVLARFLSMPQAFLFGVSFHILQVAMFSDTGDSSLVTIILFFAVMVGLLLQRKQAYSRVDDTTSWKAVREVRPTPLELLRLPAIGRTRRMIIGIFAIVVVGVPFILSTESIGQWSILWIFATVLASLVVLVGWSGQMSLGHTVFLAAGAIVAGNATTQWGIPFLLAVPLGGLAGAVVAVLVGIPALRIRGLFLAVATFAVAVAFPTVFMSDGTYLNSWLPVNVQSPRFFGIGFENQRFLYFFQLGLFIIVALAVRTLRKSRAGRLLIAIRDNEPGVQAFGVDVLRTRLMAFAISGFIAAIAGGVLVHVTRGLDRLTYSAESGFLLFQLIIIGGVSSLMGAFLGALFFVLGIIVFPGLFEIISGIGGLALMMAIPGGLSQIVFGMRDAVLRVVALRRHIIVPSLFADYSPDAWEKRLTPLAPSVPSQGLGALPADQRYALPSRLYGKAT